MAGVGENLLASALDRYGLAQRQGQLWDQAAATAYGNSPGAITNTVATDPLANIFGGR